MSATPPPCTPPSAAAQSRLATTLASTVRLVLVDDHGLFREGLSRLLADEPGLELVAQCSSLAEVSTCLQPTGLVAADSSKPAEIAIDLILLDFDLGDHTAFDVLRLARSCGYEGKVLLVTAGMSAAEIARSLDEGVSGVLLKHSPPGELVEAIRQVVLGQPWFDPLAAAARTPVQLADPRQGRASAGLVLTARERAVLRGVFEGRANKEIAAELALSEGSVKAVLQQLFAKTGVRSRAQLVRIALENRFEYELETS